MIALLLAAAAPAQIHVGAPEAVAIAAVLAGDFVLEFSVTASDPAHWKGPVLFDDAVHRALTGGSDAARSRAGTWSTVGLYGLAAFPLLVDTAWLARSDVKQAAQLALVDVETLALTWGVTTIVERTVSRARPFDGACLAGATRPECGGNANDRHTSFPSGHTSVAFAMAAALCVEHTRLEIFGAADAAVCPIALTAATATGVLRIVAEKHYATDVLAGAALGTSIGAVVALTHIAPRASAVSVTPGPGLALRGTF